MTSTHVLSVEQYLHTPFEHDAEYVDGRIVERPMPTKSHSAMQAFLIRAFAAIASLRGFVVLPELRIRTAVNRYRVPDVSVFRGEPAEEVPSEPPYLGIEILSPDDSALELRHKVAEYLACGAEYVWVVDPIALQGEAHTAAGIERVSDGVFRAGEIEINIRPPMEPRS